VLAPLIVCRIASRRDGTAVSWGRVWKGESGLLRTIDLSRKVILK
jgi:hypothetical protein